MKSKDVFKLLKTNLLDIEIEISNNRIRCKIYASTANDVLLSKKQCISVEVFEKYIINNIDKWKKKAQLEIDKK
jgi:hypothetical protein